MHHATELPSMYIRFVKHFHPSCAISKQYKVYIQRNLTTNIKTTEQLGISWRPSTDTDSRCNEGGHYVAN